MNSKLLRKITIKTTKQITLSIMISFLFMNSLFAQLDSVMDFVSTNRKIVALTFDADLSPYMLKELKSRKVKSWYSQKVIDVLIKEKVPAILTHLLQNIAII